MIVEIPAWLSTPVITGLIVWFIQERYKSKLTKELENLKAKLNRENTKFYRFDKKQAKVIAELYRLIVIYVDAARSFMAPLTNSAEPTNEEKIATLNSTVQQFYDFYLHNKIYLTEETCQKADKLLDEIHPLLMEYQRWNLETSEYAFDSRDKARQKARNAVFDGAPKLLSELKDEFRRILSTK